MRSKPQTPRATRIVALETVQAQLGRPTPLDPPRRARVVRWRAFRAQSRILRCNARFIIVAAGRRGGKTELAVAWLLNQGARLTKHGHDPASLELWWVCPTWELTKRAFNKLTKKTTEAGSPNPFYAVFLEKTESPGNMKIRTTLGFTIQFKSAEHPEQLEGEGVHALVIDEAPALREYAWLNSLYPALAITRAPAMLIGRPKGRNWFWVQYLKGKERQDPEYAAFHWPTEANPHVPREAIEAARQSLPGRVFAEEFGAEFFDESGGVFQGVAKCVKGDYAEPEPAERYVIGWDVGRHEDFTALVVDRVRDRHTVQVDRFTRVPYPEQVRRVQEKMVRYDADCIMDATGSGDPPFEYLTEAVDKYNAERDEAWERAQRSGQDVPEPRQLQVIPFKYSHGSKAELVNNHVSLVGEAATSWPKDAEVLTHETKVYEWKPGGRSGHPDDDYDDVLQAKMMCSWYEVRHASRVGDEPPIDLSSMY